MKIICCITRGTGAYVTCDSDGCIGGGDDDVILKDGNDISVGTISATEILGTCRDAGSNCARAFTISAGSYFSIAAPDWLYYSDIAW